MSNASKKVVPHCAEREWCDMANYPAEEHAEFHAGDTIPLTDFGLNERGAETGWWGWLVEQRGGKPYVAIEYNGDGKRFDTQIPAVDVAMLLWATETPEARAALVALLGQVES